MLYHLVSSVLKAADTGSVVRIHVSRKGEGLNVAVWVSHPWLGDGLPHVEPYLYQSPVKAISISSETLPYESDSLEQEQGMQFLEAPKARLSDVYEEDMPTTREIESAQNQLIDRSSDNFGLLLSCHLAQLHGGQISIQGSPESGYRYVVSLPKMTEMDESI